MDEGQPSSVKEGKYALNWTRLSCHRFVANRVRPPGVQPWELPSPVMSAQGGQALVAAERAGQADQDGRRLVRHSRRLIFQLSDGSSTVEGVLDRIGRLSPAPS